ncbi:MAG: hypothetical protein M3R02_24670 [Chloroflexota bacterium]|nr:hypothetical protein [Chloroflexota bacterium]
MRLSHDRPAPSSPPTTPLRDRVRGQGAARIHPEPPPPDLTRALEAIRQDANDYFEALGRSPRGLKNWDLTVFMKAIRAVCVDPAVVAWDASDLTLPQQPNGAPIKRQASSNGATS